MFANNKMCCITTVFVLALALVELDGVLAQKVCRNEYVLINPGGIYDEASNVIQGCDKLIDFTNLSKIDSLNVTSCDFDTPPDIVFSDNYKIIKIHRTGACQGSAFYHVIYSYENNAQT